MLPTTATHGPIPSTVMLAKSVVFVLIPFVVYNLTLRALDIASLPEGHGLPLSLDLMQSTIFFNLGFGLLWFGLFAATRGGPLRKVIVIFFHAAAILVV